MKVLVVNAGSSSLKYQLFDTAKDVVLAKGNCERIGIEGSLITHKTKEGKSRVKEMPLPTHADAISLVVEMLLDKEVDASLPQMRSRQSVTALCMAVLTTRSPFS